MTALRELAARWKAFAYTCPSGPLGEGRRSEAEKCADELIAILNVEGDGGAVGGDIDLIASIQSVRDRWMGIASEQSFGDQLDGDFDVLLEASNTLKLRANIAAKRPQPVRSGAVGDEDTFYIDCEFDGHNGPLLSLAIVGSSSSIHIKTDAVASDPWVMANVLPMMDNHDAATSVQVPAAAVGTEIRKFIGPVLAPTIIADSPVDIGRFCRALSTTDEGGWASADYPHMIFRVENVDCYPTKLAGAIQHNAWWDAMALRATLEHFAKSQGESNV
jgi:hypothetical protein